MTRNSKAILACLLALAAASCMTVGEDELPDVDGEPGLDTAQICADPGCQEQGRTLLSAVLDVDGYLSVRLDGYRGTAQRVDISIDPTGVLTASDGMSVAGVTLTASNAGTIRIDAVSMPADEPGPQYVLAYTPPGGTEVNPCVHGTAIAVDGDFDTRAHHDENTVGNVPFMSRRISFACKKEGVAYKCEDWGYEPGSDPTAVAWAANQACGRAARADYCMRGTSHTLDETYVRIWDTVPFIGFPRPNWGFTGLNVWPPPVQVYKFESVWPLDDKLPPKCLNRERWQGLQVGELDDCDIAPADPRVDPMAQFCETMSSDRLTGSIIFESLYTSIRLEEWTKVSPAGTDRVSTVSGYYPGPASSVPTLRPFSRAPGYQPVKTLGTLIRSLPGSIDPLDMTNVFSYTNGFDRVLGGPTTVTFPPSGYNSSTLEGMVFTEQPDFPPTVALYRYQDPVTNEHYNGTDPNGPNAVLLGYILGPE